MKATTITGEAARLIRLTAEKARKELAQLPGHTALQYLMKLYQGNGWVAVFADPAGNDALLLSDPKSPHNILLIVKCITQEYALTYAQAREALMDFEDHFSPRYKCMQFAIVALNGIAPEAEKLEQFNLLLQDWSYVEDLVKHYSSKKIKEPRIQLFAHNKQTYNKVRRMMKHVNAIAVVQATGTGKSFLIAKLLQDFEGERRLVMAPSHYVINQVKEHIHWDAGIEFMTYARSMNLSQSEIAALNPKMIVLDEFHRCGAEEWGRGVQNILNAAGDAFKIGTSATPVRYMDNGRDMSQELFANNIAENLSLAQAIVRNILPMPRYVCALYSLREEVDSLKEKIAQSRSDEADKKKMLLDLEAVSINWELSNGVPAMLKKHLQKRVGKFIVFCRDEEHLFKMEETVAEWFAKATEGTAIKTYRIFNNETKSYANLQRFKGADAGSSIHLLLSINMLNEGLHVNEVSGVVLLRPTLSPNIFYQQIGRCLKVGANETPVIFDLVNNFRSIRTKDFMYDLEFARLAYAAERGDENLKNNSPVFTVTDEVREITEVFGEIRFKTDNWEAMYERLVAYKEMYGTCDVSAKREDIENRSLWNWLHNIRSRFKKGLLEPERFDKLVALGIEWKLHQFTGPRDERWEQRFLQLCEFREKYGHCNASESHKEFGKLHAFVSDQRYRYGLGNLEAYRIQKLLAIGLDFERQKNFSEGRWQFHFDELVAYKAAHGHFKLRAIEDRKLGQWVTKQRSEFKKNKLDSVRRQKLESIGFEWTEDRETVFEKNLAMMVDWYREHGHTKFPTNSKLDYVARKLRDKYRDQALPAEVILRLKEINFRLEMQEPNTVLAEKRLRQLSDFYKANGHGNVLQENENYKGLADWLVTQRKQFRKGTLRKGTIERMEALGVTWKYQETENIKLWKSQYAELLSLYKQEGNTYLLKVRQNESLNTWCAVQRGKYKKGELSKEQIEKLNAVDFKWDYFEATWEEHFAALLAFKKKYGHSRVPQRNTETVSLSGWCSNVRRAYFKGKLQAEKIKRLETIGFVWNIIETQWQETYERLKDFLKENKWLDLYGINRLLHGWVSDQRKEYKNGKLTEERIMLLNMLGITWVPFKDNWTQMYEEFVRYRQTYNTGRVPYAEKSFNKLWNWCTTQRAKHRNNTIPAKELQLLNDAGFDWDPKGLGSKK